MPVKVDDKGRYVSDNGQWVWDGEAWIPADQADAQPEPQPEQTPVRTCAEEACRNSPRDYVRLALTTIVGAMSVEVLLCSEHIATLEMGKQGSFLYIRPRDRLDMNGH